MLPAPASALPAPVPSCTIADFVARLSRLDGNIELLLGKIDQSSSKFDTVFDKLAACDADMNDQFLHHFSNH